RLTGSGLSIMEWAPVSGALPPLTDAEWERVYGLYQQIPQYQLLHAGFGLGGFKQIFWLEWVHRLWGRLMGVVLLVPLIVLWITGRIDRQLVPRLVLIFMLGGLQGAVGWFMVASGFFPDATAVSPYRLVVHLVLALSLYAALLWTALSVLRPASMPWPGAGLARWLVRVTCVLVALTIIAGGFVAGTHAGLDYNTFPLMDGHFVPEGYTRLDPVLRNLTENIAAVQFDHRLLATATVVLALGASAAGLWTAAANGTRAAFMALAGAATAQYALGIATLLFVVPVGLAVLHQAGAVLVLTASLAALHALRRPHAKELVS
ncbi:MAG: COX15/CtaA family protein, partial [Acetobacteraceae bacterium]|nr:COX15/CtaA family protein [Acetobacteraceae bacterium]